MQLHFIPPQSGLAIRVQRGDLIRVIDPRGQQVADLWAFVEGEPLDWLSTSQTRDITERLFPLIGECFFSDRGRALLTLVSDDSPGPHDMLYPACNGPLYERAGFPNHPNCRDNFLAALAGVGITPPAVPIPSISFKILRRNRMAGSTCCPRSTRPADPSPSARSSICCSSSPLARSITTRQTAVLARKFTSR